MIKKGEIITSKEVLIITMDALHYLVLWVLILFIVYQLTTENRKNQHKKLPPSPPSVPIIGNFQLVKRPIDEAVNNLTDKYGPIFYLRLGSRTMLVLSSRSAIEECFFNNDIIFSNRPLLPSRKDIAYSYTNLEAPYGNHWRNLRRFCAIEIFSARRLQISSEIRAEEIRYMIKHLYKNFFKGVTNVDVKTFFYSLTFNISMKMVAGKRWFEAEELNSGIAKAKMDDLSEMFSPFVPLVLGDYFPFLRWLTYYGEERKLHKTHKRKDAFIQALLDAHQNTSSSSTSVHGLNTSQTIIDILQKLQESEPEFYTNDVIKGIIQVMLTAGVHTSAGTMGWVVSKLISNPQVFQNARDEIDNQVGTSRLINDTDLVKLPYLHCIINESIRTIPVGVLPPRESSEDCTVGGYHIPRGTQLFVDTRAIHKDPELWIEPDRFKPERFLECEEENRKIKFIGFGLGRRVCPGEGMGRRVMALSLGTLIQCFELEEARDESQGPVKSNPKMPVNKSVEIVFRPRAALTKVLAQL